MRYSTLILYAYLLDNDIPYKMLLELEERRRYDRRVPRCALRPFVYSSFKYLYLSKNDQALINATGHDHSSFNSLLELFQQYYKFWTMETYSGIICKKVLDDDGEPMGKERDLSAYGCLGLVLMWYRTRGSCARGLAMMFGQTSTPMYK